MKGNSNPKLEAAFDLIREVFTEAVSAAEKQAVAAWLADQAQQHGNIKSGPKYGSTTSEEVGERAPRGAARQLVERVLRKAGKQGISPSAILDQAETVGERMLSYSTIRLELSRGSEENRYVSENGRWYSAQYK